MEKHPWIFAIALMTASTRFCLPGAPRGTVQNELPS